MLWSWTTNSLRVKGGQRRGVSAPNIRYGATIFLSVRAPGRYAVTTATGAAKLPYIAAM